MKHSTESTLAEADILPLPDEIDCDIAIIGYGPVGMIMAALLGQRGISVAVFERFPQRYSLSRAGHLDGEIMRVLQMIGVANDVELIARPMLDWQLVSAEMEILARIRMGESGNGWKPSYLSYQPEVEAVIDPVTRSLGAQVYMRASVVDFSQHDDGVELLVRPTKDHTASPPTVDESVSPTRVRAAFVLGADGARSYLRNKLGIEQRDLGFSSTDELVIDFEHNDPDRDYPQLRENFQVMDVNRPQIAGRWAGGRWSRWEFAARLGESRELLESEDFCWQQMQNWGITPADGKIVRKSVYSFESRIAAKWREGRALLIGDAAHTTPPFMGQGLCAGIRDAANLAWKLAAVLEGNATPDLLDTYESEREPHVRQLIQMAVDIGKVALIQDPEEGRRRDELLRSGKAPPAPNFPPLGPGIVRHADDARAIYEEGRPSPQARVALGRKIDLMDNFSKPGWKIIARNRLSDASLSDAQRAFMSALDMEYIHVSRGVAGSNDLVDIDGEYDMWFRNTGRKIYIQRPDKYIFASAESVEALPALLDELAESLGEHGWTSAGTR